MFGANERTKNRMIWSAIKSAFSPGNLFRTTVGLIAVFAVAELLGFTSYVLAPVSSIKAKFPSSS